MTYLTPEQAANQLGFDATDRYWQLQRAIENVKAGRAHPSHKLEYWERLLEEFREEHRGKWLIDKRGEPMQI